MDLNRFIFFIGCCFVILSGCENDSSSPSESTNPYNVTNMSSEHHFDQTPSKQAEQYLVQKENVSDVIAVNDDKKMIIAIEVPHHERFQLKKINKDYSSEMKEKFKSVDITVELATDKKIFWELDKLHKQIQQNKITKKKLTKEMKHISKLMREQT
ncbi:hypothetical protein [Ornithinibacillus contaminans]|uniref:hypothetical protein n=1 Tax=Ornithinibacillus contaminans TaxID=694055 RepID=UPI00069D790B|nr:hypothetical protein [Ornithinibacillus contaminans]